MDGIFSIIMFYTLAAIVLGSAVMVVTQRNLVHCVLWLAVSFIAIAGLYMMLSADFLALVQILVYAGAVCIMMIFAIMLTQRREANAGLSLYSSQFKGAVAVALLTALVSCFMIIRTTWETLGGQVPGDTIGIIAELMLSIYVIPFEVTALLLLVALIGAIFLAREVPADE